MKMSPSAKLLLLLAAALAMVAAPGIQTTARAVAAAAPAATAAAPQKADAPQHASLDPLSFLIGDWEAAGQGQPGQGTGHSVFHQDLQRRVMIRNSFAEYPAAADRPASRHDDLMVIYADGAALKAHYYDSEGHVIRYAIATPSTGAAVFTSDPMTGAPRYRLSYALKGDVLEGTFEIAPPGKPDAFQRYLSWQSHKAAKS
ncbi:MAG: hypothetical protein ACM3PF_11695 [Bacteroidota bacterium]